MVKYEDDTYNARNFLRRFSHRVRFCKSLSSIDCDKDTNKSILDFGCGDGLFLNKIKNKYYDRFNLLGYEPYTNIVEYNKVEIVNNWEAVISYVEKHGKFDYIFCLEVLEHLVEADQEDVINKILKTLKKDGRLIISVPIEKGCPVVLKGMLRRRSGGRWKEIYSWKNIFMSFLGKPLPEFRKNGNYLTHLGFYFTDLERLLNKYFVIKKRYYSPIGTSLYMLNSQVFYLLMPLSDNN